jgi:predicted nucleic acid-binding protein
VTLIFDQIHIPRRVREEYAKKPGSRRQLAHLRDELAPYRYCNIADEVSVRLLLAEEAVKKKPRQDEGEAEAIVQASQIGAPVVIVDDKRARRWAEARGLRCHGTLWILERLREQELIGDLRPLLTILRREQIRLPGPEVQRLLAKFNEA